MTDDLEFEPMRVRGAPANSTGAELLSFIQRVERLSEEKKTIADDIKDVYGEAKAKGFDVKQMKKIVAMRKIDKAKREAEEAVLDAYLVALGMI